jgi:hypothetical protein
VTTLLLPRRDLSGTSRRRRLTRVGSRHSLKPGLLHIAVLTVVLLAGLGVVACDVSGDRLLFMSTASMCPRVCVGALIVDRPLEGRLYAGEIVTFHLPGDTKETYTHEIYSVSPQGTIDTLGIANHRPDPWSISRSDIVGRTVLVLLGAGWLLRALPFLAIAVLVWVEGRSWIRRRAVHLWDTAWLTLLVVVPILLMRPLLRASLVEIASDSKPNGRFTAILINTGLLPASFSAKGGTPDGHVEPGATARVSGASKGGAVVHEVVSLHWWGWMIVALVVLSPLYRYAWLEWAASRTSAAEAALV